MHTGRWSTFVPSFCPLQKPIAAWNEIKINWGLIMDEYCIVHESLRGSLGSNKRTAGLCLRMPHRYWGGGGGGQGNLSTRGCERQVQKATFKITERRGVPMGQWGRGSGNTNEEGGCWGGGRRYVVFLFFFKSLNISRSDENSKRRIFALTVTPCSVKRIRIKTRGWEGLRGGVQGSSSAVWAAS